MEEKKGDKDKKSKSKSKGGRPDRRRSKRNKKNRGGERQVNLEYIDQDVNWILHSFDDEEVSAYSADFNISKVAAKILLAAGVKREDSAFFKAFISPKTVSCGLYQGLSTKEELDAGIKCFSEHIKAGNKMYINGDSDADGITSATIIIAGARFLGAKIEYDFPIRSQEGHGLQVRIIEKALNWGAKCIVTTDCGTKDVEAIAYARSLGLDVIVLDHHVMGPTRPDATAIVNPHLVGEGEAVQLAAAGVAFKFMIAISDALKKKFSKSLFDFLIALAAIGTISDRVNMKNTMNRALAMRGVYALNQDSLPGLEALKEISQTPGEFKAREISRTISPLLNAPGRIGNPHLGIPDANVVVDLLTADLKGTQQGFRNIVSQFVKAIDMEKRSRHHVSEQAEIVEEVNEERKKITERIAFEITKLMDKQVNLKEDKAIVIKGSRWNSGVIGIDADRLRDRYFRPVILLTDITPSGYLKGSARSIPKVNIYQVLDQVQAEFMKSEDRPLFQTKVFTKDGSHMIGSFGGHSQACGFILHHKDFPKFKEILLKLMAPVDDSLFVPEFHAVDELSFDDFNIKTFKQMDAMAPFGEGFDYPNYILRNVEFGPRPRPFGSRFQKNKTPHVRFTVMEVADSSKLSARSRKCSAIGFGLWEKYQHYVLKEKVTRFDILFKLDMRYWKSQEQLNLLITDFKPVRDD